MKLKLVIHRLRPIIGFEHSQLRLPHAELNAPLKACAKHRRSRALSGTTRCEWPSLPCHQAQSAYLEGKERSLLSSSPPHLPGGFQDRERQLCRECGWAGGVLMEKRTCSATEGEGKTGKDLKWEGRGSHVMPSSSTAEPPPNANPQSVLCAKFLRDSHWLPQEGSQQNGEHHSSSPKFHWPLLAHSSLSFVDP